MRTRKVNCDQGHEGKSMAIHEFWVKRIDDDPIPDDGVRLLVDRLWPIASGQEAARIDLWVKELTPSHKLRKWFHDHLDQNSEFANRYRLELGERLDEIIEFFAPMDSSRLTLVTATKDLARGHVAVLQDFLQTHLI